jgi:hypothetical protein
MSKLPLFSMELLDTNPALIDEKRIFRMHALLMALLLTAAPEAEKREYRVFVDGKPAGVYKVSISPQPDGSIVETGQADVSVQVLLKTVTYAYRGTETWKDGRLVKLESSTNDDGKKFQVQTAADGSSIRVTVNGKVHTVPANVWATSHWFLPVDRRNGEISRIDVDTGKLLSGKIQAVGRDHVTAVSQPIIATHYRITGAAPADLWFDAADRLVRQEAVEEGHKTILELIKLTR